MLPPTALDEGEAPLTSGLSAPGWSKITFLEAPVCDGCGAPFPYSFGAGVRCPACTDHPHLFDRARATCLYDEESRDLILKLKHADRTDLAGLFARWIARSAADLLADADAITPVPLHRTRLFSRRYNQAAEIARPLSRMAHIPYRPDWLVRPRASPSQGNKSARGRRLNVRGAFAVPPSAARQVVGKRILLIDDVFTTGATVDACARALKRAGAAAVDVAVVARVRASPNETI